MKKILATVIVLSSLSAFADVPVYYSAHFEVSSVKPVCPPPAPGHMGCMATGAMVNVTATIGCADELVFTQFDQVKLPNGELEVYATSVVRQNPNARSIRCVAANVVAKSFMISTNAKVHLENVAIERP